MGLSLSISTSPAEESSRSLFDDILRSVSIALITTVDATGVMHTRQLPNTNSAWSDDLWFLSSFDAPLVRELRRSPDVLVTYACRSTGRFLVINGEAHVRHDPARSRALWHPVLASWLPEGPDAPSLALLQVRVKSVEAWE
jgi:general stress protein 26